MTRHRWAQVVDGIATQDPARLGYGYADTQHPWHHAAAFDIGRTATIDLVEQVAALARNGGTVVVLGGDTRPGLLLALGATGARVVTEAGATECDALVIAAANDYEDARRQWLEAASFVRAGGLVAIVDRTQAFSMERLPFDVDRFVTDLERDVLQPAGVKLRHGGGALAVHCYVQTAATRGAAPPAWPRGFRPTAAAERLGEVDGLALFAWNGRVVAVEGTAGPFSARRLEHNHYENVLVAADRATAERCALVWRDTSRRLADARAMLRNGDVHGARAAVLALANERPWLDARFVESLGLAPWNRALLLAQGTLHLFGERGREGAALLRRALDMELADGELMHTVATAYLQVLQDRDGARDLLRQGKQRVRTHKVARVCMQDLRGNVLWHYPQLLVAVQSVVHVGAGNGELLAAWTALEIPDQVHVEGDPVAYRELAARCSEARYGRPRAVQAVVGATNGEAPLYRAAGSSRASLLRPRAANVTSSPVPVTTLDALLANGALDARRCELLFVEAEGAELDVLRGATELLRHVDVVCVAIWLEPRFHGAPMPFDVQRFLRELHDGDGFAIRAFEPGADGSRGTAVFRRVRAREARR